MSSDGGVSSRDAAGVMELVADLHDLSVPATARKERLLTGTAELLRARVGLLLEIDGLPRRTAPRVHSVAEHGWEPAEQTMFHQILDEEGVADPLSQRALAQDHACFSLLRRDLMDDQAWYATTYTSELRRSANIDDVTGTILRLPGVNMTIGLSMHRAWGDVMFDKRDKAILDMIGRSLLRTYQHVLCRPADRVRETLTPRLNETLDLLLRGWSEQEIAAAMNRSSHTVHEYVKMLYRRFGVTTRAQLMALLLLLRSGESWAERAVD